jgi:hypothetical protein
MPSRARGAREQAERSPLATPAFALRFVGLTVLAVLVGACSFNSLDDYFRCKPGNKQCLNLAAAGTSNSLAGSAGLPGVGGDTGTNGGSGGSADSGGLANTAGAAGEPGAAPGEPCVRNSDCAQGVCSLLVCGDAFTVTYADTPDSGDLPTDAKWIKFTIQLRNRTAMTVPFDSLKVHYYYTPESVTSEAEVLSAGDPPGDDTLVSYSIDQTEDPGPLQWTYLEAGFLSGAGNLKSDQSSGVIKLGIHDMDFGPGTFQETDDYSYKQPTHVTVYYNDKLVSGIEPPPRTQ